MKGFRFALIAGLAVAGLLAITSPASAGMFPYPAASGTLTGTETIPADTNLSGGRAPQTEIITVNQLQALRIAALTDGTTIASTAYPSIMNTVTLGGNRTISSPTGQTSGAVVRYLLTQDATGSRTITWGGAFAWFGGSAPTLTTTGGRSDLITCVTMTHLLCSAQLNVIN
jgi:hypothetical protein